MTGPFPEASRPPGERSLTLPARVIVSLRAGFVLAVANVVCVVILSWAWVNVRTEAKTITVTGSAKKAIQSDLIVWSGRVSAGDADLPKAYDALKAAVDKTLAYLKKQNVAEKDITVSSITTAKHYVKDKEGRDTDKISSFELAQTIEVTSIDVTHVADVARRITELIKEGVLLESAPPSYVYTKLADLKITMLAEATKDATTRADQIARHSGAKLAQIREARMGVMQINPIHSQDVSDAGNSDISSFEKEITAVVHARFALE